MFSVLPLSVHTKKAAIHDEWDKEISGGEVIPCVSKVFGTERYRVVNFVSPGISSGRTSQGYAGYDGAMSENSAAFVHTI